MAEEARLESVYTPKGYHEFESRSLRKHSEARRIAPQQTSKEESRNLIDDVFLRKILWTIIVQSTPPDTPRTQTWKLRIQDISMKMGYPRMECPALFRCPGRLLQGHRSNHSEGIHTLQF